MKKLNTQTPNSILIEKMKSSGTTCSRKELYKMGCRFYENNREILDQANKEMKVLNMKRFFTRRGWTFPPKKAKPWQADLINEYYGKHLVDYSQENENTR